MVIKVGLNTETDQEWDYIHLVWQFNGENAFCNYRCPYCYYYSGVMTKRIFNNPKIWQEALKKEFGDKHIVFYLSFGEPTLGKGFEDVFNMISSEPNWSLHITTNLSKPLLWWENIVKDKLVKENRFYVNASFHPSHANKLEFLTKLLLLRENGIECPIVYVMWPPYLTQFESHFQYFNSYNFLIHVRRFHGWHDRKCYPLEYSEKERQYIARYADDGTIKYMLNDLFGNVHGKLSFAGSTYLLLDDSGNIWESPDSRGKCLGNIFHDNVQLYTSPHPFSGTVAGSVQGVSSLIENNYPELRPNFVLSFSKEGGVYHSNDGKVIYSNLHTNFNEKKIRRRLHFPGLKVQIIQKCCSLFLNKIYLTIFPLKNIQPFKLAIYALSSIYSCEPTKKYQTQSNLPSRASDE
jgi:organic radical activating enzyme